MFSTQIGLKHRGELVLGVSSAPAAGELAWARDVFTDLKGQPVGLGPTSVLAATPGLHPPVA